MHPFLQLSTQTSILPVVHGSAESALQVRHHLLSESFDCLAVPLPPSFQEAVEAGIAHLPTPVVAVQTDRPAWTSSWSPDEDDEPDPGRASFVAIDPCQPVIAGIRIALGERIQRAFIDLETARFQPHTTSMPDPYALQALPLPKFAAATLPWLPRPPSGQVTQRIHAMADRLRQLERHHQRIIVLSSILHWPWLREAYHQPVENLAEDDEVDAAELYQADPQTYVFMLGELPFITGLHERARAELEDDQQLSIDGIKELLLAARDAYRKDFKNRARPLTPHLLSCMLTYIRNLTLMERRFTPDLYTIVTAAKQIGGDSFALHVVETARDYPFPSDVGLPEVACGIERWRLPDDQLIPTVNRLPGNPIVWRSCNLQKRASDREKRDWSMQWNSQGQCSWPPEDNLIENFRAHVTEKAFAIMGADLVKTEKFTTSVKDGIDLRDTLRNWHTGEIYVKEIPPTRGKLDAVVMIFDSPADPRDYTWRSTWFAEHQNESTLAFYATDFMQELVGPGIGLATYGGALFLFPPIPIPDIWTDPRLDFVDTMEERILSAACLHSQSATIALLSPLPPSAGWRRLAKRFKKRLVHIPLAQFSLATVQQLRMVHVLNGQQIRSYAQHFIRKA